jgi:phage terminase small subunit
MPNEITIQLNDDPPDPGSALAALQGRERSFIDAMVTTGAGPQNVTRCAVAAGYHPQYGWELMRKPKILAAIREEALKTLQSGALMGTKMLLQMAEEASNPANKTYKPELRRKLALDLIAHNGFMPKTEQKITVEHINQDGQQLVEDIKRFAASMGLNARELLNNVGVTDAEFEEVQPAEEVWSA